MAERDITVGLTDGGGRGAALLRGYCKSPRMRGIVATPGNDLMPLNVREGVRFERIPSKLAAANAKHIAGLLHGKVDLVDACQDDVIAGGIANDLWRLRTPTIGPTKEAAEVEWSKIYGRQFQRRNGIPHPAFQEFSSEADAIAFLQGKEDAPCVVKADGLAAGKGVVVADNREQAVGGVLQMKEFGDAGKVILIEERLYGEELSVYFVCDGNNFQFLGAAQDNKRLNDGDEGPNTGGMGCCSNPLVITPDIQSQIVDIAKKTFEGLAKEGRPYTGVLYLGLMVVNDKVVVIEYNARWGDPEAQVVVPGLKTDLLEISLAAVQGRIDEITVETDKRVRIAVAVTSKGYPGETTAAKGKEIFGIDEILKLPGVTIDGAGAICSGGHYFMAGGRVFYVIGEGEDAIEAHEVAYDAMDRIRIEDNMGHFRKDIGSRDVARLRGV